MRSSFICYAALVTWLFFGLIVGWSFGEGRGLSKHLGVGLIFSLFSGLFVGVMVGLNRSGSAVIKHYALRLTLWLNGSTPFKFVNFLDHCARLILLERVGGGYIFIHRMLLDYLAGLPLHFPVS
jgi:hypothetical protein